MECYEAFAAADAKKYIEWARIDPKGMRKDWAVLLVLLFVGTFWDGFASVCLLTSDDMDAVVAVVPYHWNNCPYCVHTKNEIGTKFMNKTREVWQSFGRDLQASSANRLAACCRSELFNDGFTLHNCIVANAMSAANSPCVVV